MTVFIRNKNSGHIGRYPLIGNVGYENDHIVLTKDPRISATVYSLPAECSEIIRVTEADLETPEEVRSWTDGAPREWVNNYIETIFEKGEQI